MRRWIRELRRDRKRWRGRHDWSAAPDAPEPWVAEAREAELAHVAREEAEDEMRTRRLEAFIDRRGFALRELLRARRFDARRGPCEPTPEEAA